MHSMSLWGFLAMSCLAVTTVLCEDMTVNCHERIEECKKVAFDQEDPEKRVQAQARCFASFFCDPLEDPIRQDLKKRASARSVATDWRARGGFQPRRSGNNSRANKVNFKFIAACLVAVVGVTHYLKNR